MNNITGSQQTISNSWDDAIRTIADHYAILEYENIIIRNLAKMENDNFKIPDIAYDIPVNEFFKWYDTKLDKQWNGMSDKDRFAYFAELPDTKLNNIKKSITKNSDLDTYSKGPSGHKIYYKMYEFSNLENDNRLLRKLMQEYLLRKTVDKLQGNEKRYSLGGGTLK